ncbi:hypothetical protein QQ054_06890 [Oscillatoria amoena NRMC-F 0135]|nr:hypothetical protein [Oscillatoria amoena NRMC-F 0135]
MRSCALNFILLILSCGLAFSQAPADSPVSIQGTIKDFEFPIRDAKGNLQYMVKGAEARPLADGKYELKNAKATIYTGDGQSEAVIEMDLCLLDPNTQEIETDGKILFKRPNVKIQGKGMEGSFALDGDGLRIKNDVRVEIGDIQKGVKIIESEE